VDFGAPPVVLDGCNFTPATHPSATRALDCAASRSDPEVPRSETLRVLEVGADARDRELVNLWRLLPRSERYSFIFQGNAQVLDHILVSPGLRRDGRPDFDAVHINTEFSDQASDHDPPITRLRLEGP